MALQISASLKLNTAIMGARRNFSRWGQSRPFAYPLQVVDDATQMDVHKTLHSFYTTNENVHCYGNSCIQCFLSKKILH